MAKTKGQISTELMKLGDAIGKARENITSDKPCLGRVQRNLVRYAIRLLTVSLNLRDLNGTD